MEDLLKYLDSVQPLSVGLYEYLVTALQSKDIQKKDCLLRAGQVCRHIYFIQKGLLRCYYIKNDRQVCSWFMKEGDVIVSVRSFFSQTRSYEWIEALEDCELQYVSYDDLQFIYKNFPEFNFIGRCILEKYYALSEERLFSLRMHRSTERYEYVMNHFPELFTRVSNKDIASYIGVRQETISRIRKSQVHSTLS